MFQVRYYFLFYINHKLTIRNRVKISSWGFFFLFLLLFFLIVLSQQTTSFREQIIQQISFLGFQNFLYLIQIRGQTWHNLSPSFLNSSKLFFQMIMNYYINTPFIHSIPPIHSFIIQFNREIALGIYSSHPQRTNNLMEDVEE